MAFPSVAASQTGVISSATTSHSVTLPTHSSGQLLLVFFASDGTATATASSGWTALATTTQGSTVRGSVFWRVASSASETLTVTTSASEESSWIAYAIDDADSVAGSVFSAFTAAPNPPQTDIGETLDVMWFASVASDGTVIGTTAPTSYGNLATSQGTGTGPVSVSVARRTNAAQREDPATFAMSSGSSNNSVMHTVGIWKRDAVSGYPNVRRAATTVAVGNQTSHVITLPPHESGDVLLVLFGCDGSPTVTASGWTVLSAANGAQPTMAVLYKTAASSSETLTITTGASEASSAIAYSISGASGTVSATSGTGSGSNANPPSHDAGSGGLRLWFASIVNDGSGAADPASAAPSGYLALSNAQGTSGGSGAGVAAARITSSSQTVDPGAFTSSSAAHVTFTIAVSGSDSPTGTGAAEITVEASGSGDHGVSGTGAADVVVDASGSGGLVVTGDAAAEIAIETAAEGWSLVTGDGAASVAVEVSADGSVSIVGEGAATVIVEASGSGGQDTIGAGAATVTVTADASGSQLYGIGAASVTVSASASGSVAPTGTGQASVTVSASGIGAMQASGAGVAAITITASAAAAHGVSGTASASVTVTAAGGDFPVGVGAASVSVEASASGYVGTAAAGRWLYLHTTPPAQVFSLPALRGRLQPSLPAYQTAFRVSPLVAQIGQQNDSWQTEIEAGPALLAQIIEQAPYGVRVDYYDGGDVIRSGVVRQVQDDGQSVRLDIEADGWTRALPIRTSADIGEYRDVRPLPWRIGRVTGEAVPINQRRTRWLWADHPVQAVREVRVDGQIIGGWEWRNEPDRTGRPVAIIETSDPVDDGAVLVATGDGAMDRQTGALASSPADALLWICEAAGLPVARQDVACFAQECRGLRVGATIDGGSLQSAILGLAGSIYAAFSRSMPGLLRLLPIASADSTLRSRDVISIEADRDEIATRLSVAYGVQDGVARRSLEMRAAQVERVRGVVSQSVELPWVSDDRTAADVARRMLSDMARPAYRLTCAEVEAGILPGHCVSYSYPRGGLSGLALVESISESDLGVRPVAVARLGAVPVLTLASYSAGHDPEQYTSATISTADGQRVLSINGPDGEPIVGAQCELNGSVVRRTDGAGRVSFPAHLMPPGQHVIRVRADGYQPFELRVTV